MKYIQFLSLLVLLAAISSASASFSKCPCGCKLSRRGRRRAIKSCKKIKFQACELKECIRKGRKGLSCCDQIEPSASASPSEDVEVTPTPTSTASVTPTPSATPSASAPETPSASPTGKVICPCKCVRKKKALKSCYNLFPYCKVKKCRKHKWECCHA